MTASYRTGDGGVRLSVVIATYNRTEALSALLCRLGEQTLSPSGIEVIVADDGSRDDPRPELARLTLPFPLIVDRRENRGAAAARDRGAALARGEIILFLDDDMEPSQTLLEEHLRLHDETPNAVVLGRIRPPPRAARLPIFERFHAHVLDELAASLRTTGRTPRGPELYTGNVSMRRATYHAVGGFDTTLGRSEDAELGLRLEKAGAVLRFSEAAYTIHHSDHADLEGWMRRAFLYGVFERRIEEKHPDSPHASPFRYFDIVSPLSRPLLGLALVAPRAGRAVSRRVMSAARAADALGFERLAIRGTTVVYGIEYFRGVRAECGGMASAVRSLRHHRAMLRHGNGPRIPVRLLAAVRADHAMMQRYDAKYDSRGRRPEPLLRDLVSRAGLQMMAAYRLMHYLDAARVPLLPKVVARFVRFAYGADIHFQARFDEGVVIVHGMGIAVSRAAHVGSGAILSHNVTLGDGIDPSTRETGAPSVGENVHIGPGATLLGPITIGAGSKIMPSAVVTRSVPPGSLVAVAAPAVIPRTFAGRAGPSLAGDSAGAASAPKLP